MRVSLELAPVALLRSAVSSAQLLSLLPRGTMIYLPALPTDPPDAIEQALRLICSANASLKPVPHIAASRVASEQTLMRQIDAWHGASAMPIDEVYMPPRCRRRRFCPLLPTPHDGTIGCHGCAGANRARRLGGALG